METKKIEVHKDDKCPVCFDTFIADAKLKKDIMTAEGIGTIHQACFFPFMPEDQLRALIQIRCYSIGDTIASTPAIREIRRLYPKMKITVATFYPELFQENPHVDMLLDFNKPIQQSVMDSHHFTLDAFDSKEMHHFSMHSSEFATQSALNKSVFPSQWGYDVYYSGEDEQAAIGVLQAHGLDPVNDKIILVHPHKTEWKTRDWPSMTALVTNLMIEYPDHKIVSIGGKRSEVPSREMPNFVDVKPHAELYGKLTLLQSVAMFNFPAVKLMVTPDTGALHLAATAQELPIVGIFTLIRAHFRTPVRGGRYGYKFIGVESDSGCNCTMTNRPMTNEMRFDRCPKRAFLETALKANIPKALKIEGIKNSLGIVMKPEKLGTQIRDAIENFPEDALPCFPSTEKVFKACQKLLTENP